MSSSGRVSFSAFLKKFPEVDLPVTLGEDTHLNFSRANDPLPQQMIDQYLRRPDEPPIDEFTEYIACFRSKASENFHAIVYWLGGLLDYKYILLTYNKKGQVIDESVIAGTKVVDNTLLRSVATIDEELVIYVAAGMADAKTNQFDAGSSKSFTIEVLPSGEIVSE